MTRLKMLIGAALGATLAVALSACNHSGSTAKLSGSPTALSTPASQAPRGYTFTFSDDGANAKLAYGLPDSDDLGVIMECAFGAARVHLMVSAAGARPGKIVLLSSGVRSEVKSEGQAFEGDNLILAELPLGSPALAAFRRSGDLTVAYGAGAYAMRAGTKSRAEVETFFKRCG